MVMDIRPLDWLSGVGGREMGIGELEAGATAVGAEAGSEVGVAVVPTAPQDSVVRTRKATTADLPRPTRFANFTPLSKEDNRA